MITTLTTLGINGEGPAALRAVRGYDDATGVGSPGEYIRSYQPHGPRGRPEMTYYVTSASGKVVLHPDTDEPLIDITPVFRAIAELRHDDDMEAKLRGLYAPTRARVEVIT